MMIRNLFVFFTCCIVLSSCVKGDPGGCTYTPRVVTVPASELTALQSYVAANRPLAIQHPDGFYYEINTAGTGTVVPTVCSNVTVKYAGYLTNGSKFTTAAEETTATTFTLGQLITGWQKGIPLIKAGGSINLYLPPSLGYGSTTVGGIPGNSILVFVIQLENVQ